MPCGKTGSLRRECLHAKDHSEHSVMPIAHSGTWHRVFDVWNLMSFVSLFRYSSSRLATAENCVRIERVLILAGLTSGRACVVEQST